MAKVRDIMNTEAIFVPPSAPIIEVAHQMKIRGTGVIPICDQGKFRGLITERHIVTEIVANAIDPVGAPASSVMNKHQPVISPDEDIMQAAKIMINNNVHVLAVAQNGELLGLLTLDDLARESLALAAMVFAKTVAPQSTAHQEIRNKKLNKYQGTRPSKGYSEHGKFKGG
jgi:CBS domain-containing protein